MGASLPKVTAGREDAEKSVVPPSGEERARACSGTAAAAAEGAADRGKTAHTARRRSLAEARAARSGNFFWPPPFPPRALWARVRTRRRARQGHRHGKFTPTGSATTERCRSRGPGPAKAGREQCKQSTSNEFLALANAHFTNNHLRHD